MTWRSRSSSVFQIRVNWGSPTLTATPRISSPPSPNRARPKPSPSPAPGLSLARPPPALGSAEPRSRGWLQRRRDQIERGSSGGRQVVQPPASATGCSSRRSGSPLGTPLGEPASRSRRRSVAAAARNTRGPVSGARDRAGSSIRPSPQSRGAPELRPEKRSPVLGILDQGRRVLMRWNGRGTTRRSGDGYRGLARGVRRLPFCAAEITTRTARLRGTWPPIRTVIRRNQRSRSGRLRRMARRVGRRKSRRAIVRLFLRGTSGVCEGWPDLVVCRWHGRRERRRKGSGFSSIAERMTRRCGQRMGRGWRSSRGEAITVLSACIRRAAQPLVYLAPSTNFDEQPVWSPDGRSIAFMRQPSRGDAPENFLVQVPHPFAFWIADAATGEGRQVWSSPDTLAGSLPEVGEARAAVLDGG